MKSFPPFKDKQAYTIITGSYYMIKNGIKNRLQEKYSTTCTTVVRNLESTYIMLCNLQCKVCKVWYKVQFPSSVPVIVNLTVTLNFSGRWSTLALPKEIAFAGGCSLIYNNGLSSRAKVSSSGTTQNVRSRKFMRQLLMISLGPLDFTYSTC